jgi:hypothetical protein
MKQDKIDEIVKLYQSGVNRWNISLQTGSSKKTVNKVLSQVGIDFQEEEKLDYENRLSQIIPLYRSGVTQVELETRLHLTRKTIRAILKNSDAEYREGSEAATVGRGNAIDHKAFDNLEDEQVLYWIGLIYTDGHVNVSGKDNSIEVTLHEQDRELLEKFKKFLNCSNLIVKQKGSDCCRLRFFSERIVNLLSELGFTNNKSKTLIPHEKLKHSRHFWRGCVDGDGSLYVSNQKGYKSPAVSLCGTEDTCKGFLQFLKENAIITVRIPKQGKGVHSVAFTWQLALQIIDLLYKDSTVYLERKYHKYLEFKEFFV